MGEGRIMDTFFLSHGSPTLSIDESLPARSFFQSWTGKVLSQKPSSILIISGHWETTEPIVNAVDRNDTIYDFYGFPEPMYKIKYPAPGSKGLAQRVREVVKQSGFEHEVQVDKKRGLDHGAWVPLMLMYPEANIPVCQLSIQTDKDATYHYRLGLALAPLKEEGVLIIGSGSATHNLGSFMFEAKRGFAVPWAFEFDNWLKEALVNGRYDEVNDWEKKAPHAKMAHPRPDHFYPLHVAMGAAEGNSKGKLIHHNWTFGTLSYASYQFSSTPASAI